MDRRLASWQWVGSTEPAVRLRPAHSCSLFTFSPSSSSGLCRTVPTSQRTLLLLCGYRAWRSVPLCSRRRVRQLCSLPTCVATADRRIVAADATAVAELESEIDAVACLRDSKLGTAFECKVVCVWAVFPALLPRCSGNAGHDLVGILDIVPQVDGMQLRFGRVNNKVVAKCRRSFLIHLQQEVEWPAGRFVADSSGLSRPTSTPH